MDCNYGNSYGESSQEQTFNTYSLWNSSVFYNTNELIPRSFFLSSQAEQHASQPMFAPDAEPKREIVRDIYNRRIITKASLYNDPDFFYAPANEPEKPIFGPQNQNLPQRQQTQAASDTWTDQYWCRAVGSATTSQQRNQKGIGRVRRINKEGREGKDGRERDSRDARFKRKFMDAIAQPIKSSKAESIMQKMGWSGGALGKGGHGIVEPIAPNIEYANITVGFGNRTAAHSPNKKLKQCGCKNGQKTKKERKEDFVTNTLLYILEFTKNDWENEIIFDVKFNSKERRIIHQCVNEIINECDDELYAGEQNVVKITNDLQERVLKEIREYNTYVLYTESHGVMPHRQLCLYKDAPEHVYLVTPDDFKEDTDKDKKKPVKEEKCDDNPFLKSITRNLKPEEEESDEPDDNASKLIKYFLEFVQEDAYTEFRFLGPFSLEESDALNVFLNEVNACINQEGTNEKILSAFRDDKTTFELVENLNGSIVIHKRKKEEAT